MRKIIGSKLILTQCFRKPSDLLFLESDFNLALKIEFSYIDTVQINV